MSPIDQPTSESAGESHGPRLTTPAGGYPSVVVCVFALGVALFLAASSLLPIAAERLGIGGDATPAPTKTRPAAVAVAPTSTATITPTLFASPTPEEATEEPATPTPTATDAPTETPAPSDTPVPTDTPSPTATETPAAMETATAAPTDPPATGTPALPASGTAHNWMVRPLGEAYWQSSALAYLFATTGGGAYMLHHGVEFVNPMDTPVLAVADGEIVFAGNDDADVVGPTTYFYGNVIVLKADRDLDGQPVYALYGHLNRIDVAAGDRVTAGQTIGAIGMTGVAIGPHLHFEVRLGENDYNHVVNPDLWIEPLPDDLGCIVGRVLDAAGNYVDAQPIVVYQVINPDKVWRSGLSYIMKEGIAPSPAWGENFVMNDVYAGAYTVKAKVGTQLLSKTVTVHAGETVFVELRP